jgi:hypothetical protein
MSASNHRIRICNCVSHLECSRLQVAAWLTGLAHDARNRARAIECCVARSLVRLPFANKVVQTLVEELLVDDNVVGHGEGDGDVRLPSGSGGWRERWWRKNGGESGWRRKVAVDGKVK